MMLGYRGGGMRVEIGYASDRRGPNRVRPLTSGCLGWVKVWAGHADRK